MANKAIPRIPVATYRLQFRNGMTFDRAIQLIPYWKRLGITHLYASPIFVAVPGSTHGYDVIDPARIDDSLGGIEGFRRLSDSLRATGLGLVLDIVPNHMAASLENPYWRSVLKWGRRSPFASFFDHDWDRRLSLPVLSGPLEDAILAGHGKLHWASESSELVFDYHHSHYPIDPSTYPLAFVPEHRTEELQRFSKGASPDDTVALDDYLRTYFRERRADDVLVSATGDIIALLDRQPWQKLHWRDAAKGLSYRRFFEVSGLVGVRVEDPEVFDATHRLMLDLVSEGRVQGLRVDHIDGLADPTAYLERLRRIVGRDLYLVVEKILEGDERLPEAWPVDGTTGYEFIADIAGLLTAESPELDRGWREVAPEFGDPEQELARARRLMTDHNFDGEVRALIKRAQAITDSENRPLSDAILAEAVRALVAGFGVYRTYGTADSLGDHDTQVLVELFSRLSKTAPRLRPALSFLEDILLARVGEKSRESAVTFRTRLQHLTGPVLAKSLEDTFFYRYNRLIALNEVGGDPIGRAGGIDHFHVRMRERSTAPCGLSTTSTHDTKRGEDARARLYAISEAPDDWIALARRWRQALADGVAALPDGPAPEPAVEWLLFQSLAGMLPHDFDSGDEAARDEIRQRFLAYVEKALREAKLRTNWWDVNDAYEQAVKDYAASAIGSASFMAGFWRDIQPFVRTGIVNSLSQTLIKLTAPGVPDIYQGAEAADLSLVDPDNRRSPDFEHLTIPDEAPDSEDFAATKAWLIARTLALRGAHPDLFAQGDYLPLESIGKRRENVVAFARRHHGESVAVVVPRLVYGAVASGTLLSGDYWNDTAVRLPDDMQPVRDIFDGWHGPPAGGPTMVATLFERRPFALLLARD